MKNTFAFTLFLLTLIGSSCRKDTLHWQQVEQIKTVGNTQWNTIQWLPSGIGLIGGGARFERAAMLVSTDKGATWQPREMPSDSKGFFASTTAPDGTTYFAGFGLNVVYSADAMSNYQFNRIAGPNEFPSAISFPTSNHGIIVINQGSDSGKVVHFDNELNFISTKPYPFALHDIKMFDAQHGIAVGSGVILSTQDGGYNWQRLPVIGDNFYRIFALNSQHIVVCGIGGYIVKSIDGGASWRRLRNGSNLSLPRYSLWDILFVSEQIGYAVGEKGLVIYTDDGGEHWSEYDSFTKENLRFISVCPDGKLIIGGEAGALFRLAPKR